ncbi:MAG: AmmeMemoRadiSam system protein A [Bacilli bacterium]
MKNLRAYFVPHPPLIIPQIGKGEERGIKKTIDAYQKIAEEIARFAPDTIIVISPHAYTYEDYYRVESGSSSKGDFDSFHAPSITFNVSHDQDFVQALIKEAGAKDFPAGTSGRQNTKLDHGIMIPLFFINKQYTNFKVVRLSFSGLPLLSHYNYGRLIQNVIKKNSDKKYVFIASGDLSHMLKSDGPYGFAEEGPLFDSRICEILKIGNFLELFSLDPNIVEGAGECGFHSLMVLAGLLDRLSIKSQLLSYEGPFGVGYAIASFQIVDSDQKRNYGEQHEKVENRELALVRKNEDPHVSLARFTLETYVKLGNTISIDKSPPELLNTRAGVFVSIKKHGKLRGCIGTIRPTTSSVAQEIIQNAISSGTDDPRFSAVTISELPDLVYSVDVLKDAEKISSLKELDIKKYGIIVRRGGRSGLLLPNLEGIKTVGEQISIALRKAGIDPDEPYTLERFEVERHQ